MPSSTNDNPSVRRPVRSTRSPVRRVNGFGLVVTGIATLLLLSGIGAGYVAPTPVASHDGLYGESDQLFSVQQGDRCVEVSPLGDGRTSVDSFYDYRNSITSPGATSFTSYSAYGARRLQVNQRSVVFLYEGSGGVSLGFLHDERATDSPDDAPFGGAASVAIRGLPTGEWVVRDDYYRNGTQSDRWRLYGAPGGAIEIDWIWKDGRTDGAVFRGLERLDRGDRVRIEPAFNQDAVLWDATMDPGADVIRDWQFVGGGGQHVNLSLNEPITVGPGPCQVVEIDRLGPDRLRFTANGSDTYRWSTRYLPVTATGETNGVHLSMVGLSFDEAVPPFEFDLSFHGTRPAMLSPVEDVTSVPLYVTTGGPGPNDSSIETVTVRFDVSVAERRSLSPDQVVVFQYRNGSWEALPRTRSFEVADAFVVEATAPGLGPLAIATREPNVSLAVEPASPTVERGQPALIRARLDNRGHGPGEVPLTFSIEGRQVERRNVTVPAGGTQSVTFSHVFNQTGTRDLDVNGHEVTLDVEPPRPRLGISDLRLDSATVEAGEPFEVVVTVRNVGNASGTVTVPLEAFGTTVATREVTLDPGEPRVVTFERTIEAPGTYTLQIGNVSTEVIVTQAEVADTGVQSVEPNPDSTREGSGVPDLVIGGGLLLAGVVAILWLRW